MKRSTLLTCIVFGLLLAGCSIPGMVTSGSEVPIGFSPATSWFDMPLNGSRLPLGPVDVVAHGTSPFGGNVDLMELSVDGAVYSSKTPDESYLIHSAEDKPAFYLANSMWTWVPDQPGNYTLQVRTKVEGAGWGEFANTVVTIVQGPLPDEEVPEPLASDDQAGAPTSTPPNECDNRASYVADVTIPHNSNLAPGVAFTKTWRIRNEGSCTWNEEYNVVFAGGAPMSNTTPLPLSGVVAPGSTVDISVPMAAPTAPGVYLGNYEIQDPQGVHFGLGINADVPLSLQIVVGATPTPRPPNDTQPPRLSVSHSPSGKSLPADSPVTFTATALDNVGVTRVEIFVQVGFARGELVKTCNNTTTCSFVGTYSAGQVSYSAKAYDAAGNQATAAGVSITFFTEVR